jgi:hypothetical protein
MIGDDVAQDANRLARNYSHSSKKDHNIILIEKSERILSGNDNLPFLLKNEKEVSRKRYLMR